ncbi:hypothetical protein [Extensimonas vulgaris]|uniref:Uncharacterized protein n=1 Tax=Extensimonas vulgaris TaxID=1031594 RepID=A0A369ANG1_9BURK|nr:hypothetical protein [Extensimonas vulgaris]RCX10711.1 hypothetical protein DFR45_102112 [Extensimonas vulgaris]TWI41353.1 hypothetical protein IP95_00110 [Extensimonas vulgaris]
MADLSCPVCGTELDMSSLFACEMDHRALSRLATVSIPLGARVLQYVALFTPPKQRLTASKKIKLILQLLPDLERQAITWKGRDWPAPLSAWAQAIDQMLAARDLQRLELPMKGHGYLYAILSGMADRHEAAAEQTREAERRSAGRAHSSDAPTHVGALFTGGATPIARPGSTAPMPAPRPAPAAAPAGTSPTVRAMREAIAKRKGETP